MHITRKIWVGLAVVALLAGLWAPPITPTAQAAGPWYVSLTGNNGNACNLPAAPCASINGAVAKASAGDVVYVTTGVYYGTGTEVAALTKPLTLSGGWNASFTQVVGQSTLDGQGVRRGLVVPAGVTVTALRLIIQNGYTTINNSAGGVTNSGTLSLSDSLVAGSQSELANSGGGLFNNGVLTVTRTTVTGNGGWCGGGILNSSGDLFVDRSVVFGNSATNAAGICSKRGESGQCAALAQGGCPAPTAIITASAIYSNGTGGSGGGMYLVETDAVINNTTITGNYASYSGAGVVLNQGISVLNNVTIANNTTLWSDSGLVHEHGGAGDAVIRNSLIANNQTAGGLMSNCAGPISSAGYNVGNTACAQVAGPGDVIAANVLLGPLDTTEHVRPLLPGSPAINAGDPAGCFDQAGGLLATDQRGAPRLGRCDAGAYEYFWELTKTVTGRLRPGHVVTYTIGLRKPAATATGVTLTDPLPPAMHYISDTLTTNNGLALASGNTITWTGTLTASLATTITFQALLDLTGWNQLITNTVAAAWQGFTTTASATIDARPRVYVPVSFHSYCPDNYFTDFTNAGGWPYGENASLKAGIIDGQYQVISKQTLLFLFRPATCARMNYIVEADMRWDGHTGGDLGLLFGVNSDFSQYHFVDINTDYQAFVVFRRNANGSFTVVVPAAQTAAIHSGTQWNHLKLTRNGIHFSLAINGAAIGSWWDESLTGPTWAGLAMAPYSDQPNAEARFDNFGITRLTTSALETPADPAPTVEMQGSPIHWPLPVSDHIPAFDTAR